MIYQLNEQDTPEQPLVRQLVKGSILLLALFLSLIFTNKRKRKKNKESVLRIEYTGSSGVALDGDAVSVRQDARNVTEQDYYKYLLLWPCLVY
jgi:hypothetical protein